MEKCTEGSSAVKCHREHELASWWAGASRAARGVRTGGLLARLAGRFRRCRTGF
jgi:hypothetical protein